MFIIIFILICKLTTFSRGSLTRAVPVTCIALPSSVTSENKWVEGIAHPAHAPPPQKKKKKEKKNHPYHLFSYEWKQFTIMLCKLVYLQYSVAY